MRRADRLLKIVHFLRSRRRAVTAKRIADEFGVCTRTVYRDIQDLIDAGAPIAGEAGVGYLIDKSYYLPPLCFDASEMEAIGLGISMVQQWTDETFATSAKSALEKIQAILPATLQGELEQITTYSTAGAELITWQVSFSTLRECIRGQCKIEIRYCDEKDSVSSRTLRPIALIFSSPVWLLVAWCEKRRSFRHFRLDRISDLRVLKTRFDDEADKNLSAYLREEAACQMAG